MAFDIEDDYTFTEPVQQLGRWGFEDVKDREDYAKKVYITRYNAVRCIFCGAYQRSMRAMIDHFHDRHGRVL